MTKSKADIEQELSDKICKLLSDEIKSQGEAVLAVSGGSTPLNLFDQLSKREIEWDKVKIIPVDDRVLPDDHKDQNGKMIKEVLLKNQAATAEFIPLVFNAEDVEKNLELARDAFKGISNGITVCILGMGTDGHTASLFPGGKGLEEGMDLSNPNDLLNTVPATAPYNRITLNRSAIEDSKNIFLHIYGSEKKEVLEKAMKQKDIFSYPIYAFTNHPNFKLYWTD